MSGSRSRSRSRPRMAEMQEISHVPPPPSANSNIDMPPQSTRLDPASPWSARTRQTIVAAARTNAIMPPESSRQESVLNALPFRSSASLRSTSSSRLASAGGADARDQLSAGVASSQGVARSISQASRSSSPIGAEISAGVSDLLDAVGPPLQQQFERGKKSKPALTSQENARDFQDSDLLDTVGPPLQQQFERGKKSKPTLTSQENARDFQDSSKTIAAERSPSAVIVTTDYDRQAKTTIAAEGLHGLLEVAIEFVEGLGVKKKKESSILSKDQFQEEIKKTSDHSQSLRNDFSIFHLNAPIKTPDFPQAVSSMGFPFVPGIHFAGKSTFDVQDNGWGGDRSNPDAPDCREARIQHVLESTIRDTKTLDSTMFGSSGNQTPMSPVAAIPDIQAMIRSDENIVAFLNCAEVHGIPNSTTLFSKGFVQAAIVERPPGGARRLIIYALSGNLACVLNERVDQIYEDLVQTETKCCCCHKQKGHDLRNGALDYEYSVVSQSLSEISMMNIENTVVNVQVTKKKMDSVHAKTNPIDGTSVLQFGVKPKKPCCNCDCRQLCFAILKCILLCLLNCAAGCLACIIWLLKCMRCQKIVTQMSKGSRSVEYNNVIGRDLGYTSILNVGGAPKPIIYARDAENGFVTACEHEGSAHIVTVKNDMNGVPWKIEETRDERVVIEISYRSVLKPSELSTCHLVMNKAADTSKSEFVGELAKYAQTDTANLAVAGKFANELLPMKTEAAKSDKSDDKKKDKK